MNTLINFSKDSFLILRNGILVILALFFSLFCFGLAFHTMFIFAGVADILVYNYSWTKNEATFCMLMPLLWLGMIVGVLLSDISPTTIKLFMLASAALVILLHVLLFTTNIGSLYLRNFN